MKSLQELDIFCLVLFFFYYLDPEASLQFPLTTNQKLVDDRDTRQTSGVLIVIISEWQAGAAGPRGKDVESKNAERKERVTHLAGQPTFRVRRSASLC